MITTHNFQPIWYEGERLPPKLEMSNSNEEEYDEESTGEAPYSSDESTEEEDWNSWRVG